MATKYADIVTIREGNPSYNIEHEEELQWTNFIANKQFNNILRTVIKSVRNTDVDAHRSFWISGTYGTGKSHAAAVIKHLLCDEVAAISKYVDDEYKDKDDLLRQDIYSLREKKRLLPVTLYGQNNISHKEDLSLQLQRAISEALQREGIYLSVKTDFDNLVEHIERLPEMWQLLIDKSPQLASVAPTVEKLKSKLQSKDNSTFIKVVEAQRNTGVDIRLAYNKLADWFFEVQSELAKQKDTYGYDGLLIVWDEFTEVVSSEIGLSILVALQEIDEIIMKKENNSYFLYISHPSAFNGLDNQEREKTKGRYHFMPYQMETVSAFTIMSRKFRLADGATDADRMALANRFYQKEQCTPLLTLFAPDSTRQGETKQDLLNLYPLHPSTANLATYYAREAGSSSRSVFEFLGNNDAVFNFLHDENHFLNGDTITADYLWDFVQEIFNNEVIRYGVVTERFNARHLEVENKGDEYAAVFKGILLLNALNNIAASDTVTPTGDNIARLFVGTSIEPILDDILRYFDEKSIIQRLPGDFNGLYSIQFSALPTKDIEEAKQNLKQTEFKRTEQLLCFDEAAVRKEIDKWLANVTRQYQYKILSLHENESLLLNAIDNYHRQAKSYEVFMAMLFGRNTKELDKLKEIAERACAEERFRDVVFVVFDEAFTDKNYERFIEFMANSHCAGKYNQKDQQKAHRDTAFSLVKDWLGDIRRSNFVYYLRGVKDTGATQRITSQINGIVAPQIFSKGPESLEIIRSKAVSTYWQKASVKTIVNTILSYNTKTEINKQIKGQYMHVTYLLQDSVDENLEWVDGMDVNHPLYIICNYIEDKFKNAHKSESFNLGQRLEELTRPPYGLYQTTACMAMVAFAMRKWVKQIFDLNGKPREVQHLVEDIVELFKSWENNKPSNKLDFRFETKDSRNVCDSFVKTFKLNNLKGYSDISSLTDARNAFKYEYLKEKGFPFWSLKYADSNIKDGLKTLIDNVLRIIATDNTRDPQLLSNTLDGFTTYKFELKDLLNDTQSFRRGFENYLLQLVGINFQSNEFEEAFDYLEHHLQNTKGLWSEEEVSKEMSNWRAFKSQEEAVKVTIELIGKIDNIDDCKKYLAHGDSRVVKAAEERIRYIALTTPVVDNVGKPVTPAPVPVLKVKRDKAISKVQHLSDVVKARDILLRICKDDNVAEQIIDIINEYDA